MSSDLEPAVDYTQGFGSFDFAPPYWEPCPRGRVHFWSRGHERSRARQVHGEASREAVRGKPVYAVPRHWEPDPRPKLNREASGRTAHGRLALKPSLLMGLPLEIRYKIYKFLILRLYGGRNHDLDKSAIGHGIRFSVSDHDYNPAFSEIDFDISVAGNPDQRNINSNGGPDDINPVNLFETYKAIQDDSEGHVQAPSGWTSSRVISDTLQNVPEPSSDDSLGESSDDGEDLTDCHEDGVDLWRPSYVVSVGRVMDPDPDCSDEWHDPDFLDFFDDCRCEWRQGEDYDVIRYLSQVSPQITRELGACLWMNATVDFEDPELFFLFVKERPAVLSYIRGLVLNVKCYADPFDTLTSNLMDICGFVSRKLDLRFCTIKLSTALTTQLGSQFSDAHILANEKVNEWKEAFRSLKVREKFDLRVDRGKGLVGESGLLRHDEIDRLERRLLDLWLPECLQRQEIDVRESGILEIL